MDNSIGIMQAGLICVRNDNEIDGLNTQMVLIIGDTRETLNGDRENDNDKSDEYYSYNRQISSNTYITNCKYEFLTLGEILQGYNISSKTSLIGITTSQLNKVLTRMVKDKRVFVMLYNQKFLIKQIEYANGPERIIKIENSKCFGGETFENIIKLFLDRLKKSKDPYRAPYGSFYTTTSNVIS